MAPNKDSPEQIIRTMLFPKEFAAGSNNEAPNTAPTLPLAADIPFNVDRQDGENVMDGSINV
jgi:hypothetical protein